MLTFDANLQLALDLVGVFVFALTGGLVAVKKRSTSSACSCSRQPPRWGAV